MCYEPQGTMQRSRLWTFEQTIPTGTNLTTAKHTHASHEKQRDAISESQPTIKVQPNTWEPWNMHVRIWSNLDQLEILLKISQQLIIHTFIGNGNSQSGKGKRHGAPVLIWPAQRPTARSAIVVSSVSPERCEVMIPHPDWVQGWESVWFKKLTENNMN